MRLLGQETLLDNLLIALLCNGHVLLEGYPGTAKTRAVKLLGQCLGATMGRIQFTPDLLPADVTGAEVFHHEGEQPSLSFQPGPIFNNLILADEINRAPAKVQSALLEAMQERQVTVAGQSYPLAEVFLVLATQNPIEQEGTYPLPEAQMDRFLLKTQLDYPDDEAELDIIRLVRQEERQEPLNEPLLSQTQIMEARAEVGDIRVPEALERYMVALVMASRRPERYPDSPLPAWLNLGASPRASIALDKAARAMAWLDGRDVVLPEDVQAVFPNVIAHRIYLSYQAQAEAVDAIAVAEEILRQVALP
ncbi:MAG: AAA family ATPase [Cellvibrionaceae bacterium]|nr:AAA family ATPase [Cellvibrionaceae bacterium]